MREVALLVLRYSLGQNNFLLIPRTPPELERKLLINSPHWKCLGRNGLWHS